MNPDPKDSAHDAKRQAQSAERKTVNVKDLYICTLCAMRYALCDLTWPEGQVFASPDIL